MTPQVPQQQQQQQQAEQRSAALAEHFADLTDPRRREPTYPLMNIVTIAVCAVICGADDFVSIAEFGRRKKEFFAKFLDLSATLADRKRLPGLAAIGMAVNETVCQGKATREVRYYIVSQWMSAKKFAGAVRSHWGIENSLHWQLDVTFGEDQCRLRKGHAAANFSSLRRLALSLLKNNRSVKIGIKNKRLTAGWDNDYLAQVLCGK